MRAGLLIRVTAAPRGATVVPIPTGRGLALLADVADRQRRDGPPQLVIRRTHPVVAMPVLPRRGHEIGQAVEELNWRELDDAIGPRPGPTQLAALCLEHLVRYCARPAFAIERLAVIEGRDGKPDRVRYTLARHKRGQWIGPGRTQKSTMPDGQGVVNLSPHEFLDRLADLVPPPRKHRHRYHGVFAPNHPLRRLVTALALGNTGKPAGKTTCARGQAGQLAIDADTQSQKRSHDTSRIAWAKLLSRIAEEFPLVCPACGGDIRLISFRLLHECETFHGLRTLGSRGKPGRREQPAHQPLIRRATLVEVPLTGLSFGKSTFLTAVGLINPPTSGQVRIGGTLVMDGPRATVNLRSFRRQHIGYVFQKSNLIPFLSAIENVQIAMELNGMTSRNARARAAELLDELGVGDRLDHSTAMLSGGQQ